MKSVQLTAYPRPGVKHSAVKKLRRAGRVPGVIYGKIAAPQALELDLKALQDTLQHAASENIVLDLTVENDPRPGRFALLKEVQHHPLSGAILHVDFHEVSRDEQIEAMVPVESTGEPVGVKVSAGVLEHVMFKIRVRCLPMNLPANITLDVSHLDVGQSIHIGDIVPPEGVVVLGDKDLAVLRVAAPVVAEEPAPVDAAAAPTQPEMLKEKKEPEKEAGKDAPKKDAGKK